VSNDELSLVADYFGGPGGSDGDYDVSNDHGGGEMPEPVVDDSADDLALLEASEGFYAAPDEPPAGPTSFAELEQAFEAASPQEQAAWLQSLSPDDRAELLRLREQEQVDRDVKMLLDSVDRQGRERVAETREDTGALEQAEREVTAFLEQRAGRGADVQMLRRVADEVYDTWVRQGHEPSVELVVQALEAAAQGGRHAAVSERVLRRA
jgi:hypothetical protein